MRYMQYAAVYCCIFAIYYCIFAMMYCGTLRYVLYIASNNTPHPGGKEKNLEKISHFNSGFIRALVLPRLPFVSCGRDNDDNKTNDSAAQGAVDSKDNNDRNDNISGAVTDGIGGAGPGLNPVAFLRTAECFKARPRLPSKKMNFRVL